MIAPQATKDVDDLYRLQFSDLPASVVKRAQAVIADTLAVAIIGASAKSLTELSRSAPTSGASTTPLESATTTSADWAALLNATSAVWNELDEGYRGSGHPASHVLFAALAVAEESAANASQLLTGVVAGYELQALLGRQFALREGVHPHGVLGAPAAALAAATALGFDPAERRLAVNLAVPLTSASLFSACTEGATIRNVYAGAGARTGVLSTQLVRSGFTASVDPMEMVLGTLLGNADPRGAESSETDWAILDGYFKRWPTCAFTHSAIDALEVILSRRAVRLEDVEEVFVRVPEVCMTMASWDPTSELAARFSIPVSVAVRLAYGTIPVALHAIITDAEVLELARRVSVDEDAGMTSRWPAEMGAEVALRFADGTEVSQTVTNPWQPSVSYAGVFVQEKCAKLLGTARAEAISRFTDSLMTRAPVNRVFSGILGMEQ